MVEEDEEAREEGAGRFAESRVGGEDANEEDEQREEVKERVRFDEDGRREQQGRRGGGGAAEKALQRAAPDEGQEGEHSEYEVENVIAYRETRRGVGEWRVRWKGFTAADDTWEKRANLEGSPAFWKKMDALQHNSIAGADEVPQVSHAEARAVLSPRRWRLERKRRSNARSNSKRRRRSTGRNAKGGGRGQTTAEDREAGEEEEEEEGNNVGEAWIHRKMPTSFRSAAEREARGRSSGRGRASQTGVTGAAAAATRGEKEEKEGKHRSAAPVPAAALEATGPPEVLVQERARGSRKSCGATREQSGSKNSNSNSSSRKSSSRNSVNRDSSRRTSSCSKNSRSRKSSSSRHRNRQGQAAGRVAAAAGGAGKFVAARAAAASGSAYRRKRGREPPRKKRRRRRKGSEAEGSESSVFDFSDSSVSSFPVSSFLEEEKEKTAGEAARERERAGRKNQGERAAAEAEHDTEEEEGSAKEEEESDERSSRGGEEEGDDVSECSSGSTTAEDMNDPFDASVYPIIYSNDTEPPTSHLPDEKLLGERLSIYRFRYHRTDTRQYLRLRRRKCEARESSSLSDEDEEEEEEEEEGKEEGEAEQCQEKECSSSSRTSRPERSSSNNTVGEEEAAEGGGRRGEKDRSARRGGRHVWSTAFPRKTKREFTTVLVQYMIDAKYVYALPFERMRFYCPQLLLSYLMARTTFKGTRTGKQRRLTELEEEGEEQEESEQETEEAAGNCGGSSPATEKTGADDSENEEQQHEGHDNTALHPPAEGRRAASEPADFTEEVKRGNRQESETEETEDDGKKPKHKQLVPVGGEEQMDHCCAGRDGDTEATNNVRCVEEQLQQQIHRKMQRETVHGSLDLSEKTADNVNCASNAHMQYNSHTCKRRRAGAAALAATASALGAIARGATATGDETTAGGAAAGAPGGNAEVMSKQRDAEEVSDDDTTASIKEGQQAARATAATTHCVAEKGDRRREIPPPEPDVHAVLVTGATGTEGAVDTANEQTPVELHAAQDVAEMAVPAAAGDVSAAGGDTVEGAEAAHAVWMNSRRGEQAVRRNAAEDAGRGRRTGGKRENSRRREAAAGGSCSHKRGAGVLLQGAHAASSDDNVVATAGESEDACSTAVDQQEEKGVRGNTRAEEHGSTSLQCYSTSSRSNKQQGRDVHSHDGVHTSMPLPTSRTRSQQSARLQAAQPR